MALDLDRIQKPIRKLRTSLKKMGGNPAPADIHKFRTNSRRVETSLQILSLDAKSKSRRVAKQIARLRKRAGKIRDMDVLTEYLTVLAHPSSEDECVVRMIEYLGGKRKKHVKKFEKTREGCQAELRLGLKRISKKMLNAVGNSNGMTDRDAPVARVAGWVIAMISDLKEPLLFRKDNLHPYRLKVKELRNLLQMAEVTEDPPFVEKLREVKDAIGEWHDWEVLSMLGGEVLDHGKSCKLVEQLRRVAETKYASALSSAESMRRVFLHLSSRRGGRSSKRKQVTFTGPVLAATARVAA